MYKDVSDLKVEIESISSTTSTSPITDIKFTNTHLTEPILRLAGNKYLTGRGLVANEFKFDLYEADSSWTLGNVIDTVSNTVDGSFQFDSIYYDTIGEKYYVIKENVDNKLSNVTYDETEYRVHVSVKQRNVNEYYIDYLSVIDKDGHPIDQIVFNNEYDTPRDPDSPSRTSARFIAKKELEGRDLKASEFTFELKDKNGEVLQTKRNTAIGTISFTPISYNKSDIGTHYYTISEVIGNDEDITYDTTEYNITVEVSMSGTKLVAKTYVDGVEDKEMIFTNTYSEEEPEEPTDPVDPVDPIDPVDPTDPTDPVDPVDPKPEKPVDPGHDIPPTADANQVTLWLLMMLLSLFSITTISRKLKDVK